jgi:GNAT superfamily N-acetyltransferase
VIRLGTPADYPAVAAVFRTASLSNDGDRDQLLADPKYLILGSDSLEQGRTHLAEQEGAVVGFASWVPAQNSVYLEDLFVEPAWMRRGIATALVARIVGVLASRGVSSLEVTANPHALAFYRSVGFRDIGAATTDFGTVPRMRLVII